uniref:C2H2-type domain-containing protein n=1 Tax=Pyramimonas obovata TaxID=1411642 RepID=A0A7S0MYF9_9CHLO|mmetsp:Transcript_16448/g.35762  ORF Transcript_16448/g.35762 Transcript_16448/m.35762 type:complete len:832 (+) Transcript_16448:174-2669(+)
MSEYSEPPCDSLDSNGGAVRVSKRPLAAAGVAAATAAAARKRRNVRRAGSHPNLLHTASEDGSQKRGRIQRQSSFHSMPSASEDGYYPCKVCGKVCTSAQQLGGHQNSHREEKSKEPGHPRGDNESDASGYSNEDDEEMYCDEVNEGGNNGPPELTVRIPERSRAAFSPLHLDSPTGSQGSKPNTPRGMAATQKPTANKAAALAGRARPTNNQLLYKAHFRWEHYHKKADYRGGPDATEACASVTSAFLQVLRALYFAERNERNILKILSGNTRRTKMVALGSGSHRVPEELRRHSLGDEEGNEYSTNLDRNRYGNDDQYLSTVIRYDLEFLGLCPSLVEVEIIDAKSRDDTLLISQTGCICGKEGLGLPHSKPQAASQRVAVRMPTCGRNPLPPSPSSLRSFKRSAAPAACAMGGIGMLLDIMSGAGGGSGDEKPHAGAGGESESEADGEMSEAEGSEVEAVGREERRGSRAEAAEGVAETQAQGGAVPPRIKTAAAAAPPAQAEAAAQGRKWWHAAGAKQPRPSNSGSSGENYSAENGGSDTQTSLVAGLQKENQRLREALEARAAQERAAESKARDLSNSVLKLERCKVNLEVLLKEMRGKDGEGHRAVLCMAAELEAARLHMGELERCYAARALEVEHLRAALRDMEELRRAEMGAGCGPLPGMPWGPVEVVALQAQVVHLTQCLERSEAARKQAELDLIALRGPPGAPGAGPHPAGPALNPMHELAMLRINSGAHLAGGLLPGSPRDGCSPRPPSAGHALLAAACASPKLHTPGLGHSERSAFVSSPRRTSSPNLDFGKAAQEIQQMAAAAAAAAGASAAADSSFW